MGTMPQTMENGRIFMSTVKAVVVACDIVTAYGWGIDDCWQGLLSAKTAINRLDRFSTKSFQTGNAAVIPNLKPDSKESLVMQMLIPLLRQANRILNNPDSTCIFIYSNPKHRGK